MRREREEGWRWPCSSKINHDVGNHSKAENDNHDPDHFDDGNPSWVKGHARFLAANCATALIWTMDEETNDRWRFGFFVGWTLFLPLVWLVEWYGWYGFYEDWQNMPNPLPAFTYGRKVISDFWTGVGGCAWAIGLEQEALAHTT